MLVQGFWAENYVCFQDWAENIFARKFGKRFLMLR